MAKKDRRIYLDTAAAAPVDPRVARAMRPYESGVFGNPASLHQEGVAAAKAVGEARRQIAALLGVQPAEIIFTSGATESNRLAILDHAATGGHSVFTTIEHSSILDLDRAATLVPVDGRGVIDLKKFKEALTPETKIVSVGLANNEIGTIQPVREISKIIHQFKAKTSRSHKLSRFPLFHTDASQAARFLELFIPRLGVDLLTLNAAKIYGPKGVGLLFARRGLAIERAGTENVAGIIGLAKALELTAAERAKSRERSEQLRGYFIGELKKIPGAVINGTAPEQLPHLVNVTLPTVSAEQLVLELDARGIAASTGSACAIPNFDESYVIMALGRTKLEAEHSLRFSFDRTTTKNDLRFTVTALRDIIKKYQSIKINARNPLTKI